MTAEKRSMDPKSERSLAINGLRGKIASSSVDQIKDALEGYGDLAAKIFREAPIPGAQLQGQDLRGFDFENADLTGADFTDALIAGARFDNARLTQAQLRKAQDWKEYVSGWVPSQSPVEASLNEGDRFSFAPFAPELVLLPASLTHEIERPAGVKHDEWKALGESRLAMALMPVSLSQFSFHAHAAQKITSWSDTDPYTAKEMSIEEVRTYIDWIREWSGANFRYPSHGLLAFIARKGGHDGDEAAATSVETRPHLQQPASADLTSAPGEGRCNKFGLHDIFGNTREIVEASDSNFTDPDGHQVRLASLGGSFRDSTQAAFDLQTHRSLHVRGREHGLRLVLILPRRGDTS